MILRIVLIALALLLTNVYGNEGILISDAWIAEGPQSTTVHAAYLTIENRNQDAITLLSITSPNVSRIELHQSITEKEITRMVHHEALDLASTDVVELKPGGFHLMLYNADSPLKITDSIPLIFEFSDGTTLEVQADVRNMSNILQKQLNKQSISQSKNKSSGPMSYQDYLPQHLLSGLMYKLSRYTWAPLKNILIKSFIRTFGVDMTIAEQPDPSKYPHFNAFFTRALKQEARPIDSSADAIVSPVDGVVSQIGHITDGKLIQAKGKTFTLTALLAGDNKLADKFVDGHFITLYLSPRDYHRIHMPLAGNLQSMIYVPGKLYSVSPAMTEAVDNLFARNERVINIFDSDIGFMALIMVGAIFVGSMETVWAGEITPATNRSTTTKHYQDNNSLTQISKGEEAGRFNMGSSVILLFEKDKLQWINDLKPDHPVTLGEKIAEIKVD